jgi:hypothetical protein
MERERTFNPSACGSKPPGSAILLRADALRRTSHIQREAGPVFALRATTGFSSGPPKLQQRRAPFVASAKKGANLEIIGPVTVAAERGGLLIRWLAPTAGSNPAWSSNLLATVTTQSRMMTRLYPNWQRECVESAFSGRSSRPRRTILLRAGALRRTLSPSKLQRRRAPIHAPLRIW